ncbi:MAG: SagB/ThcOx family dehydrogenase [candidate division Zixibacteria bacterium]|nr:SagB/ThcOx family dehydrogenase [candidate division Zixibacteria bacterium]
MFKCRTFLSGIIPLGLFIIILSLPGENSNLLKAQEKTSGITLPKVSFTSKTSVEEALAKRRSIRDYKDEPLKLEELSQLLWSAQGITSDWGGRTAPSAGAKYPLEIFAVVGKVEKLDPGIYRYIPQGHSLIKVKDEDRRNALSSASLDQSPVKEAPVVIVVTAIYKRTMQKYGERGIRYAHIEVGHACQNIYLQAESLNLGTVEIGAFEDEEVKKVLNLRDEEPLAIMPVGNRSSGN